jgi:hypothetical protein
LLDEIEAEHLARRAARQRAEGFHAYAAAALTAEKLFERSGESRGVHAAIFLEAGSSSERASEPTHGARTALCGTGT